MNITSCVIIVVVLAVVFGAIILFALISGKGQDKPGDL